MINIQGKKKLQVRLISNLTCLVKYSHKDYENG